MPSKEFYTEQINHELSSARNAFESGNNGKGRVCARRAAGFAIAWYLSHHHRIGWGTDVMTQLHHLKKDSSFPQEVRDAADRLTTRISEQFAYPFAASPLEDSIVIVEYILMAMNNAHL